MYTRGNILCEKCLQFRASAIHNQKQKHEHVLQQRISDLEKELSQTRINHTEELKKYQEDNESLGNEIAKLKIENQELNEQIENINTDYKSHIQRLSEETENISKMYDDEINRIKLDSESDKKKADIEVKLLKLKIDELSIMETEANERYLQLKECEGKNSELSSMIERLKKEREKEKEHFLNEKITIVKELNCLKLGLSKLADENQKILLEKQVLEQHNIDHLKKLQDENKKILDELEETKLPKEPKESPKKVKKEVKKNKKKTKKKKKKVDRFDRLSRPTQASKLRIQAINQSLSRRNTEPASLPTKRKKKKKVKKSKK